MEQRTPATDSRPPAGRTNRRVVFPSPGEVRVEDAPMPAPGPGEILVETRSSLISSGTELAHLHGPPWRNHGRQLPIYPHLPGYSNAGVVVEVGRGTTRWRPGDRVASTGGHAGYLCLGPSDWVIGIPDGVSDDEAAFCRLATIAVNGYRAGPALLGEDAVVIGLGMVGQLMTQCLRLAGCRHVIGLDLVPARLDLAHRIGAVTAGLDPVNEDVPAAVFEATDGRGADVVYEGTGRTESFDLAFALARYHGCIVSLGSPRWPAPVDMQQQHIRALRVVSAIVTAHPPEDSHENRWSERANGQLAMELVAGGRLNVRDLLTHTFSADDAPDAYEQSRTQRQQVLGMVLRWGS